MAGVDQVVLDVPLMVADLLEEAESRSRAGAPRAEVDAIMAAVEDLRAGTAVQLALF